MNNSGNNVSNNNGNNMNNKPNEDRNANGPNNDKKKPNGKKSMTAKDMFVGLLWVLAALFAISVAYYIAKPFVMK